MWESGRSPYGERGLKYRRGARGVGTVGSLSLRRAWIEIGRVAGGVADPPGRSPYGERGLK